MQKFIIYLLCLCMIAPAWAQEDEESKNTQDEDKFNTGVTVTPSHVDFSADLGEKQIKKIKITNYTKTKRKFSVTYLDFDISDQGKSTFMPAGKSTHSLSSYMSISPSLVELEQGESQEVVLTLAVPNADTANIAFWGVVYLKKPKKRKLLNQKIQGIKRSLLV